MSQVVTSYLNLETLKQSLGIKTDTNDEKLLSVIGEANAEIDSRLTPYTGTAPLEPGTAVYFQATRAAARYARSIWYERMGQLDRAKHADDLYENKIKIILEAITAEKPERQQTLFIKGPNPLNRLYDPGSTDEYITEQFF